MIKTRSFDPAEYIRSPEAAAAYMEGAFADRDPGEIVDALDVVARALGATEPHLERGAGVTQILEALDTLGLKLTLQSATGAA